MATNAEKLQQANWTEHKHAPLIECPDKVKADEVFQITAGVGKDDVHPNTPEHHINYITLFFQAEGAKEPDQISQHEFTAHGESTNGTNQGSVYTQPEVTTSVKLSGSGTLLAVSSCNIHNLRGSKKAIRVV